MSKKKNKYIPKPFESTGERSDTSANIYMSMLEHPSFKALSTGAKVLYLYCKAQYYGEKSKPCPKYETLTENERQQCFTMNKRKWARLYEIYGSDHTFRRDMDQLIKAGFVDIVENGKSSRTKSIYMLSDRWRRPP